MWIYVLAAGSYQTMSKEEEVELSGMCDAECGSKATVWYGQTSAATCGSLDCIDYMDGVYEEHCIEMDHKTRLEEYFDELI